MPNPTLDDPEVFKIHQELSGIDVDWFRDRQRAEWSRYLELPMPVRTNEKWRFANLKRIREMDRFEAVTGGAPDAADIVDKSKRFQNVSGRIILVDDSQVSPVYLEESLAGKGVIFTTLVDAIVKHPELVQKYFMQQSPELGSEKFEALHVALLRNGVFLYVPDDVEIKDPFVVYNWALKDKGTIFPHTLFITGRNSKANLIEFQECANEDSSHLVVANAHLYAEDGAKPSHTIVQNWNLNTLSFQLNTNNAQGNTEAKSTLINVGSAQARQEIHGKIFGSGSNVEMHALNVPNGSQEFDQRTLQTHIAPNSRSDLLFKNALMDKSRTIFSGLIIVEEDAQQTDAYQTNNNLMMSEDVEANSLPGLEIKANDVKCSHGATTGRIDESELFYFLARGIPRMKAQELMLFGYFEEIIVKLDNPELVSYARELVQMKFAG
ncbi:Fe-S cluster assembly protein SufD [Puniceicoccales bacterium CK1056]|uniref:Fe-S cluster assembly protein SufD n=1 Tax=Oceanipulchritudo coccoides TaxID=2706888 RepID=A0A6B2LWN9_9BACT|nr:Fe-S cluster assembly protein SufD [Oceanipulchritudo coccoides]NDV60918.1 Fe-S cluster assembly protein SufD [Oceanipulchritudo coccoides]